MKNDIKEEEETFVEEPGEVIEKEKFSSSLDNWQPKTELGKRVKEGLINDIDQILDDGRIIMEPEITEKLLPNIESELLLIGQSKGKFGGGQRRVFRQTQKKTSEGNKIKFTAMAVIGNSNGYIGIGIGHSKETVPAREKALRNAKLNIFKIIRGSGSWQSTSNEPHSVPFTVTGKCGSVQITLIPAPKGKGLVCEKEVAKVLKLAGIKDVWSKTKGQTRNKINLIKALEQALRRLSTTKIQQKHITQLAIHSGDKHMNTAIVE
ncbi:MAG: 30S ribosomal protein S5 [Candidatus Woesearchaeota archaeon]